MHNIYFWLEQIWAGPLSGYRFVALLVNRGTWSTNVSAHLEDIGIPPKTKVKVRDLWEVFTCLIQIYLCYIEVIRLGCNVCYFHSQHKTLEEPVTGNLTASLGAYGSKMYLLTPVLEQSF